MVSECLLSATSRRNVAALAVDLSQMPCRHLDADAWVEQVARRDAVPCQSFDVRRVELAYARVRHPVRVAGACDCGTQPRFHLQDGPKHLGVIA